MDILRIENLGLTLNERRILDGLSMDIWRGHIHAIVGPNGAGKSTLAYAIMGLAGYRDHEGDIVFEGESLRGVPVDERARRGITLAWQEPARFEGLSVRDFIAAGAKAGNGKRIQEALDLVGLEPSRFLPRAVDKTLSGGERKRIEIASIVAMEPRLLILDEPDSGIDVEALECIFNVLRVLKERGTTVLLITHSLVVLRQAEHAFLICDGRLLNKGPVDKIAGFYEARCAACAHPNLPSAEEGK
ncbi:MAG: ABC transporter ATP-binding protein [Candidatus Sumerlaeota bacterium]|nr:ABC transporter ATP-binding protein [Candidatus Sumerlaeota bacterium]